MSSGRSSREVGGSSSSNQDAAAGYTPQWETIEVEEEPVSANPVGRYYLYQTYQKSWESWAKYLADLYKGKLHKVGIFVDDETAYAHIFTGVDKALATALENKQGGLQEARTHYEMCSRQRSAALSIMDLMPKTWGDGRGRGRHN